MGIRIILSVLICTSLLNFSFASSLAPSACAPLFEHLIEINKEWNTLPNLKVRFSEIVSFDDDESRIQTHLQVLTKILNDEYPKPLTQSQVENRRNMLESLEGYWKSKSFPQNTRHNFRIPYFIDEYGTACAVGYLLQKSGFGSFADRVKQENNFQYIKEMPYSEITEWAVEYGFTVDELAWIQPAYSPPALPWAPVGNGGGTPGVIQAMYHDVEDDILYIAGDFYQMDGVGCTDVVAWDGQNWTNLNTNFDGVIYAIEKFEGNIVVAGDFLIAQGADYRNISMYNGSGWGGIQMGDMNGSIYDLKSFNGNLYIAGDFTTVNGIGMPGWAAWSSSTWYWDNFGYAPTGPVRKLEVVGNNLALAGDFQVIGSTTATIVANYLAYWSGDDWVWTSDGTHGPVTEILYDNEVLYISGHEKLAFKPDGQDWQYSEEFLSPLYGQVENARIYDFVPHNGLVYGLGNFNFVPFVGNYGQGMLELEYYPNSNWVSYRGMAVFDTTVYAGASYDGLFYTGGIFTEINSNQFNRIAATELGTPTSVEVPEIENRVNVFFANSINQVIVSYQDLREESQFGLYDISGRIIHSCSLQPGSGRLEIPAAQLPPGTYVYQTINSEGRTAGKVGVLW